VDIKYAKDLGYAVKLLAIAKREGKELTAKVHPALIPKHYLLSSVSGVYNAIFINADLVGKQVFYGQGAGKLPTASAILSDIIDISHSILYGRKSFKVVTSKRVEIKNIKKMGEIVTRYYLHFSAIDTPGVLANIADILGDYGISIASVVQKERREEHVVPIVMLTHDAKEKNMQMALKKINKLSTIKRKTVLIRLEA